MSDSLADADARYRAGDYVGAEVAAARALDAMERAGAPPGEQARARHAHGYFLYLTGRYDEARARYEEARALWSQLLGPTSSPVISTLNNLAMLDDAQGNFEEARERMREVVALRTADGATGAASAPGAVAQAYNNLGLAEEACGDRAAARVAWESAAAIGSAGHEAESASVNLAGMLAELGDLSEAARLYDEVLVRREARLGPDHPETAAVRVNAAAVARASGHEAQAVELLEAALTVWRRTKGEGHPDVATALGSLGAVYNDLGRWSDARGALHEAIGVWTEAGLGDHTDAATAMNNLGVSYLWEGDARAARVWLARALGVRERALSQDHPALVPVLVNTARAAHGTEEGSLDLLERAVAIADSTAGRVLASLSGAEQHAYVQAHFDPALGELLRVTQGGVPGRAPLGSLLGRRGLLVEGLRRRARLGSSEGARALQDASAAVAQAARSGSSALAELDREREHVERALLREGVPVQDPWRGAGLDDLQAWLGPGRALVHLTTYGDLEGRDRIDAFVIQEDRVERVPMGWGDEIEAASARWRGRRDRVLDASAVEALLWSPLASSLVGVSHAWVSAPGSLSRVPWSAFSQSGQVHVAVVPSPRSLLLLSQAIPSERRRALVVGDVAYGRGVHRSWPALRATLAEADAVMGQLAGAGLDVRTLSGWGATATEVGAGLEAAAVAHVGTHGFFEEECEDGGDGRGMTWSAPEGLANSSRSLLVLNGLALAGANESAEGEVTAEAIVGLDLSGLRLLVLSACETGHGVDVEEDGVIGLTAAAHAAGARAVVGSLWKVPDEATRLLMAAFYASLGRGCSPAAALAEGQRSVRADPRFGAAVNWAGWVVSGDAFQPVLPLSTAPQDTS